MIEEVTYNNRESKKEQQPKNLERYYAENGVKVYSMSEIEELRKRDWTECKSIIKKLYHP